MEIKALLENDFAQVCDIYKQGIETGIATFQTALPTWQEWNKSHLTFARMGAFENETLLGWAALSPVSSRCVYGGVAEISIYIHCHFRKKGIGKLLLQELINDSEQNNIWMLQSGIFTENKASVQLHINAGFRIVGTREKIGMKDNIWKDNFLLERRSKIVGL